MRLRHQYIISGLPRDVTLLASDDENSVRPESARKAPEHLSRDLLWNFVRSGRSLDESYVQHVNTCRDCREFVTEFSEEARTSGLSFPSLLPSTDEKRISRPD